MQAIRLHGKPQLLSTTAPRLAGPEHTLVAPRTTFKRSPRRSPMSYRCQPLCQCQRSPPVAHVGTVVVSRIGGQLWHDVPKQESLPSACFCPTPFPQQLSQWQFHSFRRRSPPHSCRTKYKNRDVHYREPNKIIVPETKPYQQLESKAIQGPVIRSIVTSRRMTGCVYFVSVFYCLLSAICSCLGVPHKAAFPKF